MNDRFIAIQATYEGVEIGLYSAFSFSCQSRTSVSKYEASSHLIIYLERMLQHEKMTPAEILFFGVNCGPAPFTTLRVVLASVNGIAYASQVPLVGVQSLEAFVAQYANNFQGTTVALLTACNRDFYYAYRNQTQLICGCARADWIIPHITLVSGKIQIVGNGVPILLPELQTALGDRLCTFDPMPEYVSLDAVAQHALTLWNAGVRENTVHPLYLKETV